MSAWEPPDAFSRGFDDAACGLGPCARCEGDDSYVEGFTCGLAVSPAALPMLVEKRDGIRARHAAFHRIFQVPPPAVQQALPWC